MRLVQVGCGVNAMTSRFAQTPTHIAAFGGHPECLLWLLQAGADINRQDYVGEAPIHKAARAGSLECINALLIQGAKSDMRNATGLTAADLAHAQGFRECAEILSNAQNLQRNLAHSQSQSQLNEFFMKGTGGQNGQHSQPTIQGRNFLNGVPNRKRSFDSMDVSQIKKARINGLDIPSQVLNGNGPLGGAGDFQMECVNMESDTVCSALGAPPAEDIPLNGHSKPQIPIGCDPTLGPDIMHYHQDIYTNTSETICNGTAGSQVEHQKSVTAEQFYDHALFSTMLLYHGS